MKAKVEVFTSPTCPHCPSAVKVAKEITAGREDAETEEMSVATNEGRSKAQKYGIMSTPTLIINGPEHPEPIGMTGTPSRNGLSKAINISLGRERWEEKKKGLFDKFMDLFGD
ncbi:MAG: thioredoxin family protein [Nanobdellota archaeon]